MVVQGLCALHFLPSSLKVRPDEWVPYCSLPPSQPYHSRKSPIGGAHEGGIDPHIQHTVVLVMLYEPLVRPVATSDAFSRS